MSQENFDWRAGFGKGEVYRPPRGTRPTRAGVEDSPIAGLENTGEDAEPLRLYSDGFDGVPPHRSGQTFRPQRNGRH